MQAEKEYGNLNYSLDEEVYNWLLERDRLGYTTSNAELKGKMVQVVNKFGGSSRTDIEHWLQNFKEQHEILQNMPESSQNLKQNERVELNKAEAKKFIQDFTQRLEQENIIRDNIYTMIDMKILGKHLYKNKRDADVEKWKHDNITIMFCINATGNHKLSPFCIYKYTHQEAPKNLKNIPPLIFKLQGNELEEQEILADWYNNYFVKFVKQHQRKTNVSGKVFLLLKNSLQFIVLKNTVKVNNFEILLFPLNTLRILQPMKHIILDSIRYKSAQALKDFYKSLDIGKYIERTCEPWAKITLTKNECLWRKIFKSDFYTKEDNVTEEDTAIEEISEPLDLFRKAKRSNRLEKQGNNVSAEIIECIENIGSIEENIEEEDNSTTNLHNFNKLMVNNIEFCNTLQDDTGSDKIPDILIVYANAEAEGHQEQKEDIESIAGNTQRENYPMFCKMMHDINKKCSPEDLTKCLNSYKEDEIKACQEQQENIKKKPKKEDHLKEYFNFYVKIEGEEPN
ncbi:jerky protein-like [Polyergus mexicanus]|uniref:jerky protein-like n=1 Tax=Polyergus mexicanus TaxID=615972 RepID=UPI0038B4D3CD